MANNLKHGGRINSVMGLTALPSQKPDISFEQNLLSKSEISSLKQDLGNSQSVLDNLYADENRQAA